MAEALALSNSLRVIGQILQQRSLDIFELKYLDNRFFLQCGGSNPPYLDIVEFSCTPAEIKALDAKVRAKRGASFKRAHFATLPEMFRALGRHIEDQGAHLFRLGNADSVSFDDSITVEYQTRDRRRCIEELLIADIADHSIRMYKSRFADRAS